METRGFRLLPDEGVFATPDIHNAVTALIKSTTLLELFPSAVEIDVWIGKPIEEGSSLAKAHEIWKPMAFESIDHITGFPFRKTAEICPDGLTRISLDFVEKRIPGMGSFFGYKGYFISLLANLSDSTIWDVRGEVAS